MWQMWRIIAVRYVKHAVWSLRLGVSLVGIVRIVG